MKQSIQCIRQYNLEGENKPRLSSCNDVYHESSGLGLVLSCWDLFGTTLSDGDTVGGV